MGEVLLFCRDAVGVFYNPSLVPTVLHNHFAIFGGSRGVVVGGARGVVVIVIGNGHGDTSSNPGRD